MKNKEMKKRINADRWYAATVIGCFAFPAGAVWLLINTVHEFRKNTQRNNRILYSGIASGIWALTYSVLFLLDLEAGDNLFFGLAFMWAPQAVMAVYLIAVYIIHTRYSLAQAKVLSLIKNDRITSINEISYILGTEQAKAKKRIRRLIKSGALEGASVEGDEVAFKNSVWAKQRVSCRSCGAALVVDFGHTLVCEYCGGALSCVKK
jgi:hypothetical protein